AVGRCRLSATGRASRRGGGGALLDGGRSAVGEACSRAGEAYQKHRPAEPVRVALTGTDGRFEVVVTDTAVQHNGAADAAGPGGGANGGSGGPDGEPPDAAGEPPRQAGPPEVGPAVPAGPAPPPPTPPPTPRPPLPLTPP